MYTDPGPVAAATRDLWSFVRDHLRAHGFADAPDWLDGQIKHDDAWLDPRLMLAQTCGYPFATRLRGRVRLVAAPLYDHPGCCDHLSCSFVVVHADSRAASIADLRGRTAALNDRASNSGMNLLRELVAPHARDGRFFGRLIETGGHVDSLARVADGTADVAAIDCVTYGNIARFAPDRLAAVRILCETEKAPTLPFITRASASDEEVSALREALLAFAADPSTRAGRETLGLRGFAIVAEREYDAITAIERCAIALGYPNLA